MRKKIKSGIAVVLSACMLVASTPSSLCVLGAGDEHVTDFTDENSRGGWKKTSGNGDIIFTDGIGEDGYMTVYSDDNTIFADTKSERLSDGYVEMDMTMMQAPNGGRMGIIFRYNSPTDWEGIGIDGGNWNWFNGTGQWGSVTSKKPTFTSVGEKHTMRVEYRGKNVRVLEDGIEIINQDISSFNTSKAGNIGMRLWGVAADKYDCAFKVDNVKAGELTKEVEISPEYIQIPYEDAGSSDYVVTLKWDKPGLSGIKNGNVDLKEGTDYTVDGANVTIKKEYIASIKEQEKVVLTFLFDDGQQKDCQIVIEETHSEVSYTRDFREGTEGFEMVSGNGTMEAREEGVTIQGKGVFIDQNSHDLKNQEVEFSYDPLNNNCNYGAVLRYVSPDEFIYAGPASQSGQHYTNWGIYGPTGQLVSIQDSGFILQGRVEPYKVKLRIVDDVITIFLDNEEIYNGQVDGITMKAGKTGFCTTANTGMTIQGFTQESAKAPEIADKVTEVKIQSHQMAVEMDQDFPRVISYTMTSGQSVKGQELPIHELEINNKLYKPDVRGEASGDTMTYHVSVAQIGISFDVVFKVNKNVLSMNVRNVKEGDTKLYTLNFPGHSLVSMSSREPGGRLTVNNYKGESKITLAAEPASKAYKETTLAVLSSNTAAAAISGDSYKNRHEIAYQTFNVGEHTSTGLWMNEYTYRGLDGKVIEYTGPDGEVETEPWTKVSITADRNEDGRMDYQDGAIALREDCMKRKTGADTTTDNWNMIAMNVGSEAQYPFLRILDNAKKISLATDNFGQNIIIKGYQSEGHDASHPDFANYNKRAGGLEDLNTLIDNGDDFNTKIGIHINHTDVYPEAPQYEAIKTNLGAWSWYDSASQIVRENDDLDTSDGGLDGRLAQLYDKDTKNALSTTYVDVFFGTRWPMYKLIQNINGKNRGMALATEYVDEMVSYSTFAHHVGSNFGGAGNLVRFVDNGQADIFAHHQLFRGSSNRANEDIGIDGWQGAKNMNLAIQAFFERILPNKYLAQFPIMQYETDKEAVLGINKEVVTKMSNGVNVITKDGQEIANGTKIFIPWREGKDDEGKIYHWNTQGGRSTWTLPQSWGDVSQVTIYALSDQGKSKGEKLEVTGNRQITIEAEAKIGYVIYKEEARKSEIHTADTVEWSTGSPVKDMGFDSHGFKQWKSSSTAKDTKHIAIENNAIGNSHLFIKGKEDGKVSQKLTGLEIGQTYSASVWCITDEGRKASIEVKNGEETVSNFMTDSHVTYGVHHSDKYKTKAQRMQVRFTAKSHTAKLSLCAEKGNDVDSIVDFDDVRVAKVNPNTNPEPEKYTYWEDFENTDQGWGVFISTESDNSHLSQLNLVNPEYTEDVIKGTYSLKIRAGDYMRTIPATVRLEPEVEYTVSIDYKSPSADAFTFAVKSDKAQAAGDKEHAIIASTPSTDRSGNLKLNFITGNYDDYYIDITKKSGSEYYLDNFCVQAARPINRDTLGQLIEEAKALDKNAFTPESYEAVAGAIVQAEKIYSNAQTTQSDIQAAYKALEKAVDDLVSYATDEERAMLQSVVDVMRSLPAGDYKQDAQWLVFITEISKADELLSSDKATSPEIAEMVRRLNAAKDALNPLVDRTQLKAIMDKAQRVNPNDIVDGKELQSFLSAIENAKLADLKPGVTEGEIGAAVSELTTAYSQIVLKEESKNILVEEALKKTEVDERYFLEEDLKVIGEAKAALIGMESQEGVKAWNYYQIYDQLEGALANKLNRPVIPASVQIPSQDFVVSANTEQPLTGGIEGPVGLAFDDNPGTWWHSSYAGGVSPANPAQVTIDMGQVYTINQFSYVERGSGGSNGKVKKYNLYINNSENREGEWTKIIADGTFGDDSSVQKVKFEPVEARHVMFEVTQGHGGFAAAAELGLYQQASDFSKLQQMMNEIDKLDGSVYTKASYKKLMELYEEAEAMTQNLLTEQSDIDALVIQMKEAKDALVEVADPTTVTMLNNAVAEAEKLKLEEYKDTMAFSEALNEAKKLQKRLQEGEEVTKKEAEDAALWLIQEQGKLELLVKPEPDKPEPDKPEPDKPEPDKPETPVVPGTPDAPGVDQNPGQDNLEQNHPKPNPAVDTGDKTNLTGMVGILLLALAIVTWGVKKRRK